MCSALAVSFQSVNASYGVRKVLDCVSFEVHKGDFLGIIGPNGAGKTTITDLIVGLLRQSSGTINVFGHAPVPRNMSALSEIGVQTQSSSFFRKHTALEHVQVVSGLYKQDKEKSREILHNLGLNDEEMNLQVSRLSGGQQRRVAIAAALVNHPELVILDEPTAGLDPQSRRQLWGVLNELRHLGTTFIYTTHYMEEIPILCTNVCILCRGKVLAQGTPRSIIDSLAELQAIRIMERGELLQTLNLQSMRGVDSYTQDGAYITLLTSHQEDTINDLIRFGFSHEDFSVGKPTFEDAYLNIISGNTEENDE
ncbi:ABC transporter ATP-binding protein [Bifidobacterium tibiigranuli]|jgi:ABC-2 type transport system ATP-binding protein|uniref:ABC transporter ATP-binding protein n=1 Tax=Bifidobacterium tibiigranuli TaxID=2172043 RepID=UPI0023566029|nr:ABC transporter ATP-binding protein [Bifidobacterium tibiigranuli]MCH3973690.1 ABC transporter ATP-binding protein [Bifidobacterium tibiigranuli]